MTILKIIKNIEQLKVENSLKNLTIENLKINANDSKKDKNVITIELENLNNQLNEASIHNEEKKK